MSFLNININDLPDEQEKSYELLAPGWYDATIEKAELKDTKSGTGQYIKLQLGLDNGRVVFANLNIKNPNDTAQRIGLSQLKKVMAAARLTQVQNTDQFVGVRLEIKVAIRPAKGEYSAQNEVKDYRAISGAMSSPTPPVSNPALVEDEDLPF